MCKRHFPDAVTFFFFFFCVFGCIIFIISFSSSLTFTSSPSPFLFSSLLFCALPLSRFCLCCVSVLCCCRLFSILCCRRFLCFLCRVLLLRCFVAGHHYDDGCWCLLKQSLNCSFDHSLVCNFRNGLWRWLGSARRCPAAPVARRGLEAARDACTAARLVVWEHQIDAHAAASRCSRRITSTEAASDEWGLGWDRNGHERDAAADSERAPSAQLALKEREIQLRTWPPCSPDLSPLDFHLWQERETALGERQFQSQLELRAMIVRTVSALDPEAAEEASRGGHFEDCLRWPAHVHAFFFFSFSGLVRLVLNHGPKSPTVGQVFLSASALFALAWTLAQATDCDLESHSRKSICVGVRVWCCSFPFASSSFSPFSLFSFFLSISFFISLISSSSSPFSHLS